MSEQPPEEGKISVASMAGAFAELAKRLLVLKKGASVLVPIAAIVLGIVVELPLAPVVQPALGVLAVGLLLFQANNSFRTRSRLRHWDISGISCQLRQEIVLGCVVPAAIVGIAFFLPASWQTLVVIFAVLLVNYQLYEMVEEAIFQAVEDSPYKHGSTDFAEREPFSWLGISDTNEDGSKKKRTPGIWTVIRFFLRPASRDNLSWTRTVIVWIMVGACISAGAAAAQDAVRSSGHEHRREKSPSKGKDVGSQSQTGASSSEVTGAESPQSETQGECRVEPGDGAPEWARKNLYRLYRGPRLPGATEPPGTDIDIGGCPSKAVTISSQRGYFVYVVGRNLSGEVRSVAVDSVEFAPQIFLAPAAQRVLELIHQGNVPLGGFAAADVGGGDMASIATLQGTILLIRSEQTLPGDSELAAPFVELPPAVSAAWAGAVREGEEWLWPLAPEFVDGSLVYPLVFRTDGKGPRIEVVYDTQTGSAERDSYFYPAQQAQLDLGQLQELALFAK